MSNIFDWATMPTATRTNRIRVLLADDNARMLETVVNLLEPEYEIVATVADGASLIEAAVQVDPDIGIIDITMPILNGIDAVRLLKEQGSSMRVIFLTVNEDVDFLDAGFAAGAFGYVVKSHMAKDLLNALEAVIAGKKFVSSCCDYRVRS